MGTYADEFNPCVVDVGTTWQEEARSWAELVEEEQLLLLANLAVVALGGLLLEVLPFLKLFLAYPKPTVCG